MAGNKNDNLVRRISPNDGSTSSPVAQRIAGILGLALALVLGGWLLMQVLEISMTPHVGKSN